MSSIINEIVKFKNLAYEERLTLLGIPTLEDRRLKIDLIQAYKIWKGIDKVEGEIFTEQKLTQVKPTRSTLKENFRTDKCSTNQRQFFFSNRVIKSWNELPREVQTANNLQTFKSLLKSHLF